MFDHFLSGCLLRVSFLDLLFRYYRTDRLLILCHYFHFSLLNPVQYSQYLKLHKLIVVTLLIIAVTPSAASELQV